MDAKIVEESFRMMPAEAIAFVPETLRLSLVNHKAQENLQYGSDELEAMTYLDIAPELDGQAFGELLRTAGRRRCDTIEFETVYRRKDGTCFDVRVKVRHIDGETTHFLTIADDLTAQAAAEAAARSARERLDMAIEALPDGFALFDAEDRLLVCNTKYREMYWLSAPALVEGATYEEFLRFGLAHGQYNDALGQEQDWLDAQLAIHRKALGQQEQQLPNGQWVRGVERRTADGGRVASRIDITELKQKQLDLERAAMEDSLTHLANRRALSHFLKSVPERMYRGERIAVLHIDLDKFKAINDAFGHEAGDFVLAEISKRLARHTHPRAIAARVGGDEFVLAIATALRENDLKDYAEEIRAELKEPVPHKGQSCQVGASIGIASWVPEDGLSIRQTLLDADTALIQSKALGRNRTLLFTSEMREQAVRDASLASDIREGLHADRFFPLFQPQYHWPSGRICGLETLARWRRPDGRVESAGLFSQVAVETGLIAIIDKLMFEQSLGLLWRLVQAGADRPSISLNVSTAQLCDPYFAEQISWNLKSRDLDPSMVTLEILESTLLDDRADTMVDTICALSEAGFRIELDDFGTGHTAISSLRRFPVDGIKIDRSLVSGIDTDANIRAITEGIFGLSRRLGIAALAEGVETEAELDILTEIGFEYFQGFRFARPIPAGEVLELYAAERRNAAGAT